MPNLRTMVTELGTGLGMLGHDGIDHALASRSPVMRSLSPEDWDRLAAVREGGAYDAEFHAAWENGRAFLGAQDGLRGRLPEVVEWKGSLRAAGDEVAPVDLRIDYVYLVSCKYLSNILFNVSPAHLFDDLLVGAQVRRGRGAGGDWYAEVAPAAHQRLYDLARAAAQEAAQGTDGLADGTPLRTARMGTAQPLPGLSALASGATHGTAAAPRAPATAALRALPPRAVDLSTTQRTELALWLRAGWPDGARSAYEELAVSVAAVSAARWHAALSASRGSREAMLWRLLRMGSTPYFVLGSSATRSLRLRIATPWDWRQRFSLTRLDVFAQEGGQPRVGWTAGVRARDSGVEHELTGHVEVRWSHGRFGGAPEAKGYIDTPHHLVPGYFPLQ